MELHHDIVIKATSELNLVLHTVPEDLTRPHVSALAAKVMTDQWMALGLGKDELEPTPALYARIATMFALNVVNIVRGFFSHRL